MGDIVMLNTDGHSVQISETELADFKMNFRGTTVCASDTDYDEVRVIWNGMHDKKPALIVRCTGAADVIAAVNFCRKYKLVFSVRGGGHNVGGSASCNDGVMIDLSTMNRVVMDLHTKTARAQGGATWGDIDHETQAHGLAAPGGVVSTTGIGGLTLGGGLGWQRRKHGLSIDSLLSVDIVTAEGKLITASKVENADLFWGIRGGGGNFGIVTLFVFQLHPIGPVVTLCAPWYPVEMAGEIIPKWDAFMKTAPEDVASQLLFWTIPPAPNFPAEHHGKRVVIVAAVHLGPVEEGMKVIQPLRELGTPYVDLSGPLPWKVLQSAFDPFFPKKQQLYYFKARYIRTLEKAALDTFIPIASNPPSPMVLVAIWNLGGAMSRVGDDETAFSGREAPYLFSVDSIWTDPKQTDEVVSWSRKLLAVMEPFATGGMYVNFSGLGEEGEALVKSTYGNNYAKLAELKKKYDPSNMFRINQNIRPSV